MPPPPEFLAVEQWLASAREVRLAQFSPRWAADHAAIKLRDRIDDAVLARLLRERRGLTVMRMVLYDLPDDWRGGDPGERHREWVERLRRDVAHVEADGRYQIKQYVLATSGPQSRPPNDIAAAGGDKSFDALWRDRKKAFPVRPGPVTGTGFYGDNDPLYHLDLDVRDTDRLQIGPERRQQPVARDPEAEI